ncbi:MAG: hypothetical protein WC205_08185 [Opitutaceae bacterium]|jgi:hypothetical protein
MHYNLPYLSRRHLAIIGALLGASLQAAPATDVHLLAKYDFETPAALKEWTGEYAGTYKAAISWKTPFLIEWDQADAHSGSGALRVSFIEETATGNKTVLTPSIDVPAKSELPRTIIIRCFAKLEGGQAASVELRALQRNADKKPTKWLDDTKTLATVNVATGWQEIQIEGSVLAETRSIGLMFVNIGIPGQGKPLSYLVLDDLTVEMK